MAITFGNIASTLKAQRSLATASHDLSGILERLSSGSRINSASDDAAGLALVEELTSSSRVFAQGVRNINDGISLLSIADSSLEQLTIIVTRLNELASQASNGSFSVAQRKALDIEAQALSAEYYRISRSAQFNGRSLFDGSMASGLRLQAGYGIDGSIFSGLGGYLGTGAFGAATEYSMTGPNPAEIGLSDLNNDGNIDMAMVGASGVAIRLGNGAGGFGDVSIFGDGTDSSDLAIGDVNGDGTMDLITSGTYATGFVNVRLGVGDGTFNSVTTYVMETTQTAAVELADLNGDGHLDMVTGGVGAGSGVVTVRLGNGNGTFNSALSYTAESTSTSSLALKDINGDGKIDLISGGSSAGVGYTTVRLGSGDGTFGSTATYSMDNTLVLDVTLADVNKDGTLDLITAGANTLLLRLGSSNGTFSAVSTIASGLSYTGLALADLDGDGSLDLVSADLVGNSAVVFKGNGNGTFQASVSYLMDSQTTIDIDLADFNGDGVLDMASSGRFSSSNVRLGTTRDGVAPLISFTLNTKADAQQALSLFSNALDNLTKHRGVIGAFQSRLSSAVKVLDMTTEEYFSAAARIRDADIAQETADLVRTQILQQSAAAILAQANQQPAKVLELLVQP